MDVVGFEEAGEGFCGSGRSVPLERDQTVIRVGWGVDHLPAVVDMLSGCVIGKSDVDVCDFAVVLADKCWLCADVLYSEVV